MALREEVYLIFVYLKDVFFPAVYEKTRLIVLAPIHHTEMLWIVMPLLIALVLMEFYFGRYIKEELGWNTAVANSLVLIVVSLALFRHLFGGLVFSMQMLYEMTLKSFLALLVLLFGVWVFIVDFFHIIPKKLAFKISSALPINFSAYIVVVLVFTDILGPQTAFNYLTTACAIFILFLALALVFAIVHAIEPRYVEE